MRFVRSFLTIILYYFYETVRRHPNLMYLIHPETLVAESVHSNCKSDQQNECDKNRFLNSGEIRPCHLGAFSELAGTVDNSHGRKYAPLNARYPTPWEDEDEDPIGISTAAVDRALCSTRTIPSENGRDRFQQNIKIQ